MINGFTRKEVLELTDSTSNQLQYLEKVGLIKPSRLEKTGKATVLYTLEHLVEIVVIKRLKDKIPLEAIKGIVQYLDSKELNYNIENRQLVHVEGNIFWVKDTFEEIPEILRKITINQRNNNVKRYEIFIVPDIIDAVKVLWETAAQSDLVDFKSFKARAKAKYPYTE